MLVLYLIFTIAPFTFLSYRITYLPAQAHQGFSLPYTATASKPEGSPGATTTLHHPPQGMLCLSPYSSTGLHNGAAVSFLVVNVDFIVALYTL